MKIKLTDEQRKQLIQFVGKTGDARLDVEVIFEADLNRAVIAPATFLVGSPL